MKIKKPVKQYIIFEYLEKFETLIYSKFPILTISKKYYFHGPVQEFESAMQIPHKYYETKLYKNDFTITAKYSVGVLHSEGNDYVDRIKVDGSYRSKSEWLEIILRLNPSSTAILSVFVGLFLMLIGIKNNVNVLIVIGLIAPVITFGLNYLQRNFLIRKFVETLKLSKD